MSLWCKHFKELTKEELYKILQLRAEIFVVEQDCVYNDLDGLDLGGYHMFESQDNEVVSYVRILKPGTRFPYASIGRVITKMTHRNKGLSSRLMKEAIAFIRDQWDVKTIKISAQSYLKKFYESLGFVVVSEEYLEDGIPHFAMEYSLNKT